MIYVTAEVVQDSNIRRNLVRRDMLPLIRERVSTNEGHAAPFWTVHSPSSCWGFFLPLSCVRYSVSDPLVKFI